MNISMIELTNVCPHDCWFCPHSKMQRAQGFMSKETVELAIEKMKLMNQTYIGLNNIGESILHPQFFEIVDMFKDFFTTVTFNCCSLNESITEKLINSGLDLIRISVDFDCNEDLVRRIVNEHKNTEVNFKGDTRENVVRLRNKWPDAEIKYICDWAGHMDINNEVESNICPFRDQNAGVVLWDGRVTPCCFDYEGEFVIGTLNEIEKFNFERTDLCDKCGGLF